MILLFSLFVVYSLCGEAISFWQDHHWPRSRKAPRGIDAKVTLTSENTDGTFGSSQLCPITIDERWLNSPDTVSRIKIDGSGEVYVQRVEQKSLLSKLSFSVYKLRSALHSIFLPIDYPSSVPTEYKEFQLWNLLQDFCSYLRGIMSTRAILEGFGVGRSGVTALQATIQWIFRDGASLLGGLLFTSLSSHNFGQDVKVWRLFADTINNVGITLEMLAPIFQEHFLLLVCIASVCKALCGVAAGATGVAIAEHWGEQHGNIADVLAKNNAQHTVVSLLGLGLSVNFAQFVSSTPEILWSTYGVLTAVHLLANYRAMRVLSLRSINRSRYGMLLGQLMTAPAMQELLRLVPLAQDSDGAPFGVINTESRPHRHQRSSKIDASAFDKIISVHTDAVVKWLATHKDAFSLQSISKTEPILSLALPMEVRLLLSYIRGSLRLGGHHSAQQWRQIMRISSKVAPWTAPSRLAALFPPSKIEEAMRRSNPDTPYMIVTGGNAQRNHRSYIFKLVRDRARIHTIQPSDHGTSPRSSSDACRESNISPEGIIAGSNAAGYSCANGSFQGGVCPSGFGYCVLMYGCSRNWCRPGTRLIRSVRTQRLQIQHCAISAVATEFLW